MGQGCLPSRPGLASGVTLGLAIGLGGVAATALGVVADAYGLRAVLWTVAVLPIPAIALAVNLPSLPPGDWRRVASGRGTRQATPASILRPWPE
jgi:MFS transporter, FSR family, fosmidomycin resistance protein